MQSYARMVLRPALLAGLGSAAGTRVSAALLGPLQSCVAGRSWSSSSSPPEDALRKAERMVEMMGQSPQMQQMMMSVMPAAMRNPEVFKQLFGDPAMKKRIAEMIASRGLNIPDHLLDRMSPGSMDETFARAQRLGLDPSQLFTKLMSHPGLLARLQQPRVMAAFLDIAEDPSRQSKYEGDKELLEVVFKVREVMGTKLPSAGAAAPIAIDASAAPAAADAAAASSAQPPPPGQAPQAESAAAPEASNGPASSSNTDSEVSNINASGNASVSSGNDSGVGVEFNPLVALMASDPKAARWLENPNVMAALQEVHKSPWKTVKYIFNRDVMEAFKDLKNLMRGKKL